MRKPRTNPRAIPNYVFRPVRILNEHKLFKGTLFDRVKMYIRIEFEDISSAKTKETQELFFSIPNGMFLTSSNAHMLSSKEIRDAVGKSVVFWHLDVDILNKHYGGVMNCLNALVKYSGVSRVDILPIEGHYDTFIGKFDDLFAILMRYMNEV